MSDLPPIPHEEIQALRNELEIGIIQAKRIARREQCHRLIAQAKTIDDLKPVLKWLVDQC